MNLKPVIAVFIYFHLCTAVAQPVHDNFSFWDEVDLTQYRKLGAGLITEEVPTRSRMLNLVCVDQENLLLPSEFHCNRVRFALTNLYKRSASFEIENLSPGKNFNELAPGASALVGPSIFIGAMNRKQVSLTLRNWLADRHEVESKVDWIWRKQKYETSAKMSDGMTQKSILRNSGWNWSSHPKKISAEDFDIIFGSVGLVNRSDNYASTPGNRLYRLEEELNKQLTRGESRAWNTIYLGQGNATHPLIELKNEYAAIDSRFWARLSPEESKALLTVVYYLTRVKNPNQLEAFLNRMKILNAREISTRAQNNQHLEQIFDRFQPTF